MANPEVSASTIVAFRSLKKDQFLEYSGDGGFLGEAVKYHLQRELNNLDGRSGDIDLKAHVFPGRIENLKCELNVSITQGSAEIYRQSVVILDDPEHTGKLIGKLPQDSKTEIGMLVDGLLQNPNTSIENDFRTRLNPVIEVQEVASKMYRGTLSMLVRGRPKFSTNGHP